MVEVNLGGGKGGAGAHQGATPPDSTEELWLYTGTDTSNTYGKGELALARGGLYYNTGEDVTKDWEPIAALWG